MSTKIVFLSHIHEEATLAGYFKSELESEFGGFVDVFVSSDGISIPAGINFLRRIENGLIDCVAALYLLSPKSINRNWVNFEIGAIWIRNAISLRKGGCEIPTLPVCHSGMAPTNLPSPINHLNAVSANDAAGLRFAFESIQASVGGRGGIRTNLDGLRNRVLSFESKYMVIDNVHRALSALGYSEATLDELRADLRKAIERVPSAPFMNFGIRIVKSSSAEILISLADGPLKDILEVRNQGYGITAGVRGTSGPNLGVRIRTPELVSALI